jgi:two-component system NtrC family response regulator
MARILIIDDDDAFRAAFAETLTDLGHEPIEAASGRAGLDLLAASKPAAVFLDYKMAGMDGIEVLRRLRQKTEGPVPVVMLTAFASSASTIEAMKLGAFEHLTKPVARGDIERLLARLIAEPPTTPVEYRLPTDRQQHRDARGAKADRPRRRHDGNRADHRRDGNR